MQLRHAVAAALLTVAMGLPAAPATANGGDAGVFAPQAHPYGSSYGEWAAKWWQWVLTQPTPTNPLLDATGEN